MPPKIANCAKQRPHFVRLAFGAAGGEAGGGGERRRAIGTAPAPATRSLLARAERGGIYYALWAVINHHPPCLYQRIAGRQSRPRGRPRDRPRTWAGGSRGQSEGASETGEKRMGQPYGCELFRVARIWDCALCSLCAAPYGVCPCWLLRAGLSRPDGL